MIEKCRFCGETAVKTCPTCNRQSLCTNCGECNYGCRRDGKSIHLTVRIDTGMDESINELLTDRLKHNRFVKKADIIRELIEIGLKGGSNG